MNKASDEITKYLEGIVGVVEANSFERMCLWEKWKGRIPWKERLSGYGYTVGTLGGRPVHVSLLVNEVDEHRVLFIEATSEVVDHKLIREWLEDTVPDTAKRDERLVYVDAGNFANVFTGRVFD